MNDWHQYFFAGLPTVTVLLAIWRADRRMDDLKAELKETREDVKAARKEAQEDLKAARNEIVNRLEKVQDDLTGRIDRVADNLHEINLMLGRHDARLDAVEKERKP